MRFFSQRLRLRERVATLRAQVDHGERQNGQRHAQHHWPRHDWSARQIVLNDAVVHIEHATQHEVEETQEGGRRCVGRPFLLQDHQRNEREDHQNKCGQPKPEIQRTFSRHPAVGLAVGSKVGGHAEREFTPHLRVAHGGDWERNPHQRGPDRECLAIHRILRGYSHRA